MADEKVQIIIRATETERGQIKKLAEDHKKSMNQYVLDIILDGNNAKDNRVEESENNKKDSIDISLIIQQLTEKDKQLTEKDKQIATIYKLIDQQQQLSLLYQREKEQLKIELDDAKPDKANKTWWQKWFN